jgi:hypothetical protein
MASIPFSTPIPLRFCPPNGIVNEDFREVLSQTTPAARADGLAVDYYAVLGTLGQQVGGVDALPVRAEGENRSVGTAGKHYTLDTE